MSESELEARVRVAANCVDLRSCRCEKFRMKDPAIVRATTEAAREGLEAWGYLPT